MCIKQLQMVLSGGLSSLNAGVEFSCVCLWGGVRDKHSDSPCLFPQLPLEISVERNNPQCRTAAKQERMHTFTHTDYVLQSHVCWRDSRSVLPLKHKTSGLLEQKQQKTFWDSIQTPLGTSCQEEVSQTGNVCLLIETRKLFRESYKCVVQLTENN